MPKLCFQLLRGHAAEGWLLRFSEECPALRVYNISHRRLLISNSKITPRLPSVFSIKNSAYLQLEIEVHFDFALDSLFRVSLAEQLAPARAAVPTRWIRRFH